MVGSLRGPHCFIALMPPHPHCPSCLNPGVIMSAMCDVLPQISQQ